MLHEIAGNGGHQDHDRQPDQVLPWEDAVLAAALLAVDPAGLGGVVLRAHVGPLRDEWLGILRDLLPEAAPVIRVPLSVTDDRLLGGLDLGAALCRAPPAARLDAYPAFARCPRRGLYEVAAPLCLRCAVPQ